MSADSAKSSGNEYEPPKVHLLSQTELSDWIRDLELPKSKAEVHASRMQQFGFLAPGVMVSIYRNRHKPFARHYTKVDNICYCKDIPGLFKEFNQPYDSSEWRLFIDGSQASLKAVLLYKGNKKPSIPIAHAVNTKESYENMEKLLQRVNYTQHNWKICADLKVVGMLCGLQGGYTKYCCFLCKWDSRAREEHYIRTIWPDRIEHQVGKDNIKYKSLVDKKNIILPPLHIKLGLIKNFVKALDKAGAPFKYLSTIFPNLSDAKIKEGVFIGPQIKKLLKDDTFEELMSEDEAAAWNSFRLVVSCFLGNNRSRSYEKIVEELLKNYAKIGANISICSHFHIAILITN